MKMKKALAVLLSALFAFSVFTPVAFAADPETDYSYTVVDGGAVITGYSGSNTVLEPPESFSAVVDGKNVEYPVTGIADAAFKDNTSITAITLPKDLASIGDEAFSGCLKLVSISFTGNAPTAGTDWIKDVPAAALKLYRLTETTGFDVSPWKELAPAVLDTDVAIGSVEYLVMGSTCTLKATVSPSDATDQTVTWSGGDAAIATIAADTGVITPVAASSTPVTFTATTANGNTDSVKLYVHEKGVEIYGINPGDVLYVGHEYKVTAAAFGTELTSAETKLLIFESSDVSVAHVSGSVVGGVQTCTITPLTSAAVFTLTVKNQTIGKYAEATFAVVDPYIEITGDTVVYEGLADVQLTAADKPAKTVTPTFHWESSDPAVLTVSDLGLVSFVSEGSATVTVTEEGGTRTGSCEMEARKPSALIDGSDPVLFVGAAYKRTLDVTTDPALAGATVTWATDSARITLDAATGEVTGLSAGDAAVTVTVVKGSLTLTDSFTLTVTDPYIEITAKDYITVGQTATVTAEVFPAALPDRTVTWSVDDTAVATVDATSGALTGVADGTVIVTADNGAGLTADKSVRVHAVGIDIAGTATCYTDYSTQLTATVHSLETDKTVTWSSEDSAIATVSEAGLVTGVKAGTVKITASAPGNLSKTVTVTVKDPSVTITGSTSVVLGYTTTLSATVDTAAGAPTEISWSSSDESIAVIDKNGKITGKALGTVDITAKTVMGVKKVLSFTVKAPVYLTDISISGTQSFTYAAGETMGSKTSQLSAKVLPSNATNPALSWSSDNTAVATVDSTGKITAVGLGTAVIYAKSKDGSGKEAHVTVKVSSVLVTTVKPSVSSTQTITIQKGDSLGKTLALGSAVTVAPSTAYIQKLTWESSNAAVATVSSSGLVKSVGEGKCYIYARATDGSGRYTKFTLYVKVIKISKITLNKREATIYIETGESLGKTMQLTASITPVTAQTQTIKWESSNTAVATVNQSGLVTSVGEGKTYIYARSTDGSGRYAKCTVYVRIVDVSRVKLDASSRTITIQQGETFGKTTQLTATVTPTNARVKTLKWESSNTEVATVDQNGLVKSVGAGKCYIYARATDGSGRYAKCTVYVSIAKVTRVTLDKTRATITVKAGESLGKTLQLTAAATPATAYNTKLKWESSNVKVASVDQTGLVTSVGAGSCYIYARATDGSGRYAKCSVTVAVTRVSRITLNKTSLTLTRTATSASNLTAQLTATVAPTDAQNRVIKWSSSNTAIATVDQNGVITAIKDGSCYIYARATDGSNRYARCAVTVKSISVSSVTLSDKTRSLDIGGTQKLTATVLPANAANAGITWSSSNEAIATVDQTGLVTAVSAGSAKIYARAADGSGRYAACQVTVSEFVASTAIAYAGNVYSGTTQLGAADEAAVKTLVESFNTSNRNARAALAALGYLGTSYCTGEGEMDCSLLVQTAYAHEGYTIARKSDSQAYSLRAKQVPATSLLPGDLLFLKCKPEDEICSGACERTYGVHHVVMYLGKAANGKYYVVEASSAVGKTVIRTWDGSTEHAGMIAVFWGRP